MKHTMFISVCLSLAAMPFASGAQQKSSGVVSYEIMMQRPGNGQGGGDAGDNDAPNVFTMNRTLTFNTKEGKLASAAGAQFSGRRARQTTASEDNNDGGRRRGRGGRLGGGTEYIDFTHKQFVRAFKIPNNDTTYFAGQDFQPAQQFQASDKTKKIAGYTCHKATAQFRNDTYTIWYTMDIPLTFSPLNGLIPPDGGFVLSLEGSRMSYKATKLQLQDVPAADLQMPSPSRQLSQDEMQNMRRQMMTQMRQRRQQNQPNQ